MSLSIAPSEVRAVAKVLEAGAEGPEELAKLAIQTFLGLREERKQFIVALQVLQHVPLAYGPFPTQGAAHKAAQSGKIPVVENTKAYILRLYSTAQAAERLSR